jgi:hypothetical protein
MKYFYDCEFIEDGITIDLISIGIVAEDGREYYAQSNQADFGHASEWVKENVIAHLIRNVNGIWKNRATIRNDILSFMDPLLYGKPELWGYYSAYDHVAFCQLFGTMMDLPKSYPMYTRDLKQWCDALDNPTLPEQGKDEHNALADAHWNKFAYDFLVGYSLPIRIRER